MIEWYSKVYTTNKKDSETWKKLVQKLPKKDVFYLPEFFRVLEKNYDFKAELFFYGNNENYVAYPYIKKPISTLPFSKGKHGLLYDISTVEYGGPAIYITKEEVKVELIRKFLSEFHRYCINRIITEYTRLHPFIKNNLFMPNSKKFKKIYCIDLTLDKEIIWKNFKKSNRNSITMGQRKGVEIIKSSKREDVKAFYKIYNKRMKEKNTIKFYYYSKKYINDLFKLLGSDKVSLFLAKHEGKKIAGSVFLHTHDSVYYYLSCFDRNFSRLAPTNLLLHKAILWSKANKYKFFILGGAGVSDGAESNISYFKSTFTKTNRDYYRYTKIHNPQLYKELVGERKEYDKSLGVEKEEYNYFPLYREGYY